MNILLGRILVLCSLFVAVFAAFGSSVRAEDGLVIYTEEYPPYNYTQDGKLMGTSVELVKEIQKRIGDNTEIKVEGWSKAYNICLTRKDTALFSTTRTEEREDKFKWVGPLVTNNTCLFAKADSDIKIESLEDAKKFKIGAYLNDSAETLLKNNGFKEQLQSVKDDLLNAKKLMAGRIDLWIGGENSVPILAEKAGFKKEDVKPVFTAVKSEMYIVFNKDTDDAVVKAWQDAYDQMKKDGTYDKIVSGK